MAFHYFLLCALLLANVLLRTFTNGLAVLPKILNVVDLPIVGLLFLMSMLQSAQGTYSPWVGTVSRRLLCFCIVLFLGCILNLKYFYFSAAASQAAMLMAPLLLFIAVTRLPFTQEHAVSYTRLLKALIILEVIVGVLQIPIRFKTGDSESVHGTFPGNAEQYGAFLMIGILYLVALCALYPQKRLRYGLVIALILVNTLALDNKASWLGIVCALGFVLWRLGALKSKLLRIAGLFLILGLLGTFVGYVVSKTSRTLYKFEALITAVREGEVKNLGKVKAYLDIVRSHISHPHMAVVGAGLSNFYSRASRQFYFSPTKRARMYINPNRLMPEPAGSGRASDSLGGAITLTTRTPYYDRYYNQTDGIYAIGSIQIDSPFSPYAGLVGETGLLGTWLYLSIYVLAIRRLVKWMTLYRRDPKIFPLLIISVGFTIYLMVNSIYGPLIETTRLTTLLWSMIGLATVYVCQEEKRSFQSEVVDSGQTSHVDAIDVAPGYAYDRT